MKGRLPLASRVNGGELRGRQCPDCNGPNLNIGTKLFEICPNDTFRVFVEWHFASPWNIPKVVSLCARASSVDLPLPRTE